MATMNVSLPQQMRDWIDEQVATGRYANASDYVRDLVRRDRSAVARFQALVDEGRASGISDMTLDQIFEESRARALASLQAVVDSALASGVSPRDRDQLMQHARATAATVLEEHDGKKSAI